MNNTHTIPSYAMIAKKNDLKPTATMIAKHEVGPTGMKSGPPGFVKSSFMAAGKLVGPPISEKEGNIGYQKFNSPFSLPERVNNYGDHKYAEIQDFTQKLISASLVPVSEAKQHLDIQIAQGQARSLPTCEVHFDFPTLFNMNKSILLPKYPELVGLRVGQQLPKTVGSNNLNPLMTINNKRYYITPIVRKTEELGYTKIYVDSTGIYFYLKPEDLGPLAKEYFKLCEELVQASLPSLEDVQSKLEVIVDHANSAPTHGIFYSYPRLYSGKTSFPELVTLSPEENNMPKDIGTYRMKADKIFENEEHFISKIVRNIKEIGFEGANVGANGITYYLRPDQLGPKAKELYKLFFLTKSEILDQVKEQQDKRSFKNEKIVVITYAKNYSNPQIQRINYELRKHYNLIGYSVTLGYDWKYESDNKRLVMKIFIDPDDINDSKSPF